MALSMELTGEVNHVVLTMSPLVAVTRGCCSSVSGEAIENLPKCCDFSLKPCKGNGSMPSRDLWREGPWAMLAGIIGMFWGFRASDTVWIWLMKLSDAAIKNEFICVQYFYGLNDDSWEQLNTSPCISLILRSTRRVASVSMTHAHAWI